MSTQFSFLTSKQKKVYSAIEEYIIKNGIPPTVREIGEMLGEKTPGAVQGLLNRLEQKGVIKRQLGMARSIRLVSAESKLYLNSVYVPEIKRVSRRNVNDLLNIYNIKKYHPVSPDLIDPAGKYFMLPCPDDSLSENEIHAVDMLIIKMDSDAKKGDIVLALYRNHVLLRRYIQGDEHSLINLGADNYLIDKRAFKKSEVKIVGKMSLKFTKY